MIRRIDSLGRIVIPAEIRKKMLISEGNELIVTISGESILLTKYQRDYNFRQRIDDLEKIASNELEGMSWCKTEYDYLRKLLGHLNEARKLSKKLKALE